MNNTTDENTKEDGAPNLATKGGNYGGGFPPHVYSAEIAGTVSRLAAIGVPVRQIAAKVKINTDTLYKYYRDDMHLGRADSSEVVGTKILNMCKDGNVDLLKWWSARQMGWTERERPTRQKKDDTSRGVDEIVRATLDLSDKQINQD